MLVDGISFGATLNDKTSVTAVASSCCGSAATFIGGKPGGGCLLIRFLIFMLVISSKKLTLLGMAGPSESGLCSEVGCVICVCCFGWKRASRRAALPATARRMRDATMDADRRGVLGRVAVCSLFRTNARENDNRKDIPGLDADELSITPTAAPLSLPARPWLLRLVLPHAPIAKGVVPWLTRVGPALCVYTQSPGSSHTVVRRGALGNSFPTRLARDKYHGTWYRYQVLVQYSTTEVITK